MFKIKNLSFFFIFSIILIFIQFSYQFSFLDIYNINYSFQDLKYSGSKLFLNGENIYKIYLDDPSDQRILGSQYPNYSITSIYFHLPLGFFSFDLAKIIWRIFSIILLAHTYIILSNSDLEIKNQNFIIFFSMIILIISKPFNILINTGNFSIVCFWAYIFFFIGKKYNIFISLLISSIKYSFAPILIFYVFYKKNFLQIFFVFLFTIFLLFHFSYNFDYSFIKLIIAPLQIGALSTASGFLDFQTLLGNHPNNEILRYTLIFLLSFSFFYFILKKTNRSSLFDLSIVSLLTILFFKHLYYDVIFLLPTLIYSFKIKSKYKYTLILVIFYYWFVAYLDIFEFFKYWKTFILFNNILLVVCLSILIFTNLKYKNIKI